MQKKIIYLDRDGVINKDFGYVSKIEDFEFCDGVLDSCKKLIDNGFEIIIVTNQSGIGRGYYSLEDFKILSNYMKKEFEKKDTPILKIYFCPHNPDEDCQCRKPKAGMIFESLKDFSIDLDSSWLIGDKMSDVECAKNGNISNRVLIDNEKNSCEDFFVAKSLKDALKYIIK